MRVFNPSAYLNFQLFQNVPRRRRGDPRIPPSIPLPQDPLIYICEEQFMWYVQAPIYGVAGWGAPYEFAWLSSPGDNDYSEK